MSTLVQELRDKIEQTKRDLHVRENALEVELNNPGRYGNKIRSAQISVLGVFQEDANLLWDIPSLIGRTKFTHGTLGAALTALLKSGKITRVGRGKYKTAV